MSSPNDPLFPTIIKTTTYCPDSLAPRVGLPTSINYVTVDLGPSSSADAFASLSSHSRQLGCDNVRGGVCVVRACVKMSEQAWEALASRAMMRESLMDNNTEMRGGI